MQVYLSDDLYEQVKARCPVTTKIAPSAALTCDEES